MDSAGWTDQKTGEWNQMPDLSRALGYLYLFFTKDKRVVYEETSKDDIWWGSINVKMMDERKLCE